MEMEEKEKVCGAIVDLLTKEEFQIVAIGNLSAKLVDRQGLKKSRGTITAKVYSGITGGISVEFEAEFFSGHGKDNLFLRTRVNGVNGKNYDSVIDKDLIAAFREIVKIVEGELFPESKKA